MKTLTIAAFLAGGGMITAAIYFTTPGDSDARDSAVVSISDVLPHTAEVPEAEVGKSCTESTIATEAASKQPVPDQVRKRIEKTAGENHPGDVSSQLIVVKRQTEAYRELVDFLRPDGVPENVFRIASRGAEKSHEDDYSAQLTVLKDQLKGYLQLKSFVRPANVTDDVIHAVARDALENHPSDFREQFCLITNQLSAYQELQALERPSDIPENVYRDVIQKAAETGNPSDFSKLVIDIEANLRTYREGATTAGAE